MRFLFNNSVGRFVGCLTALALCAIPAQAQNDVYRVFVNGVTAGVFQRGSGLPPPGSPVVGRVILVGRKDFSRSVFEDWWNTNQEMPARDSRSIRIVTDDHVIKFRGTLIHYEQKEQVEIVTLVPSDDSARQGVGAPGSGTKSSVGAARVERLRAAGLDPSDAALSSKLRALHDSAFANFQNFARALQAGTIGQQISKQNASAARHRTAPPKVAFVGTDLPPNVLGWEINTGEAQTLQIKGAHLHATDGSVSTITFDLGNCGSITLPDVGPSGAPFVRVDLAPVPFSPLNSVINGVELHVGRFSADLLATYQPPVAQLFGIFRSFQSANQLTSNVAVASIPPSITSDPALTSSGVSALGMPVSRVSVNPSDPTVSGTDVFGVGTTLLNGFTAQASIVQSVSQLDVNNNHPASDAYRGATVSTQPQQGRLETRVAWFYSGGESLAYTLRWTLTGPLGYRPLSSMPKEGFCTDEQ